MKSSLIFIMKKQQQIITALLLTALFLLQAHAQLCNLGSSSSSADLLQSGSTTIYNSYSNNPTKREHTYTFSLSFTVPPTATLQIAASAASLQISTSNGLDFAIWGGQGSAQITLLINEDNSWSNIKLQYLASARSDFYLGTFSAGVYMLQKASTNNIITYSYAIPNWTPKQNTYSTIAQISGVKTYATSLVLQLSAVNFNALTGTLTATIALSSNPPVETIIITYIAFSSASPITYSSYQVSSGSSAPYQFIGIDQLQNGLAVVSGYGFNSGTSGTGVTCIGQGCPTSCVTAQTCSSYGGILQSSYCYICPANQIGAGGQCIPTTNTCGGNQYYNGTACVCNTGYIMVDSVCYVLCANNARIYNSVCQCIPGYSLSSQGTCIQTSSICGSNFVVVSGNCYCPAPYGLLNNQCVSCPALSYVSNGYCTCQQGYTMNPSTSTCIQTVTCGANFIVSGSTCVCPSPYGLLNNQCVSCPAYSSVNAGSCVCQQGYTMNPTTFTCYQSVTCGANYIVSGNTCICPPPYCLLNNQCVVTPANSYANSTGYCTCNPGYSLNPYTYICELSCFANAYRNTQGQCVCINGYYNQGNYCVPQGTCTGGNTWNGTACTCPTGQVVDSITTLCTYCNTPDRTVSNNKCVCSANYYPTINSCSPCMANAYYSATAGTCVCNTNNGYQMVNGACVFQGNCPFNSNYNAATQSCICVQSGQYVINGYCQSCTQYSTWNGTACVCNQGYSSTSSGLCVPNCGPNQNYNGQSCVCNSGYFIIGGACQLCDPHTTYSNTLFTCVCNPGYYGNWQTCYTCHPSCATCSGPANSQCLTCPSTSTFNNGYCTVGCSAGFYPSGGQCYQCTSSCATCTASGANKCSSCTAPAVLSASYCLTCAAGTYPSAGSCLQCDSSCTTCSAAGTTACTSCTSPAVLTSGACVTTCAAGTYPSGSTCLQCDTSCKTCSGAGSNKCTGCNTGITLSNGVCMGVCGIGSFVNGANQCVSCLTNCGICSSTSTCTACLLGYTLNLAISGATVTTTCVATLPGASSPIAFRSGVLGADGSTLLVYQGVTMANVPTAAISAGTTVLNNLFQVSILSQFATITYTQQYIPNSQYWFVITFNFGTATFVPSFQFTVKINPTYAQYFTAVDMQQSLTGSYSQDYFSATTTLVGTTSTTTGTTAPTVGTTGTTGTTGSTGTTGTTGNVIRPVIVPRPPNLAGNPNTVPTAPTVGTPTISTSLLSALFGGTV